MANALIYEDLDTYNKVKGFFLQATLEELHEATGVAKSRWSLYFNKNKGISEPTLEKIAEKLNISSAQVLDLIIKRRTQNIDNRRKKR